MAVYVRALLDFALDEVDRAMKLLAQRRAACQAAQGRADAASGLAEAAQRQYKNAEARYRVLAETAAIIDAETRDFQASYAQLEVDRADVQEELKRAEVLQAATKQSRAALAAAQRIAEGWVAQADKVVDADAVARLEKPLQDLRIALEKLEATSRKGPNRASLRRKQKSIAERLDAAQRTMKARRPSADLADDLRRAEMECDAASRALLEAPGAERHAQADLRLAYAALAEAEKLADAARETLDEAEQNFIDGIDITAPDEVGIVTAQARLKEAIPPGYELRWSIEPGVFYPIFEASIRLDTRELPPGAYLITAHLERQA
jgi:chromosome segregation ATPase